MKFKVDQEVCIGCELCTNICPSVFKMDDNGKAKAYVETQEEGQEAMDNCPVQAIGLVG